MLFRCHDCGEKAPSPSKRSVLQRDCRKGCPAVCAMEKGKGRWSFYSILQLRSMKNKEEDKSHDESCHGQCGLALALRVMALARNTAIQRPPVAR